MTSPRVSADIHHGRMALHSWIRSHRLSAISSGILAPPFAFTYCASVRFCASFLSPPLSPSISPFLSVSLGSMKYSENSTRAPVLVSASLHESSKDYHMWRVHIFSCTDFSLDFFGIYFIPYLDVGNNAIIFFQIRTRGLVSEGEWSDSSQSRPRTLFRGLCM